MPLHTWRRQHGPDILAQVVPTEGLDVWEASASLVSNPSVFVRSPRKIETLTSAQAVADHLARKTFDHTCYHHVCGDWLFWPK
jgi:hypothetical protein